jgi:hypothetical protein
MNNRLSISWWALALSLLLGTALPLSAQSILLSAGDFALLGGTFITNSTTGTVINNGDVGLSPAAETAITGFPPGVINGGTIIATGDATAQARADLVTARAGLTAMAVTTNFTATPTLGGRTLTPGVYHFDAAADLTGALFLDAQGQNNVYWVFQIGSSLTTAANASVSLINPGSNLGSDNGIFWNAGTTFIFGATNTILGNYLAGTSITIGAGASGSGRALALAAVTLDNTQLDVWGGPDVPGYSAGSDWSGGLTYDGGFNVVASTVPEPAAVLWLAPLGALGFVLWRRRAVRNQASP